MEEVEAFKCRSLHWCYDRAFADCVGVDAQRNSYGVRQGMSAREPDRPGASSLCKCARPVTSATSVVGCGGGSQLPSRKLYDTWRPERGKPSPLPL